MPESTSKSADSPQAATAAGAMRPIRSALYQRRHLAVVQLLLIGPPLLMLLAGGVRSIFAYLSMDCFYYFVVARNMVELGFVSYDQFHPTNGFHPLWQAMTAAIYWPLWKADASSQAFVAAAFLVSLALVSATLWTLHRILEHEYGTAGLLFLLFPAGAYGIASLFHSPHPFGALQTYANGMESGVLLLAYALFLWGFIRYLHHPSRMVAVVAGVALGAVALARLDHALLAVTAVPVMAMSHLHKPERWAVIRHAVLAGLLAAGMLGLYLLWSRVVVGSWLPVSGVVKLGPPGETLRINVNEIRQSIAALFVDTGYLHRDSFLWRGLQLVLPLAMAVLYCAVAAIEAARRRAGLTPMTLALIATALMTAGVASYNLAFVALMKQGEWYMPVGVLFVTLSLYDLAKRYAPVRPRRSAMTRRALAAVLILANLAVPAALLGRNDFIYERIYADAADVAEHFAGEDVRLLSYVDGIFGFGTRLPVMSGLLFTVDPEAVRLFRDEGLSVLEIAYERGFFHIPLINLEPDIFHEGMTREEVERALMERTGVFTISFPAPWHPLPFGFELEYLHPDGHLAVVKMAPRADAE